MAGGVGSERWIGGRGGGGRDWRGVTDWAGARLGLAGFWTGWARLDRLDRLV